MKKTKSVIGDVASALEGVSRDTAKAKPRGRLDKPYVAQTFFIPRETNSWLRDAALSRRTSVQELLTEALDKWLAENGGPPFFPPGWRGRNPKDGGGANG